jgi:integrase
MEGDMAVRMPSPMKHPRTGVYWYRKVIPAHLRAVVGKREIQRTLGTKNLREAKRLYPSVAERVEREIALAEGRVLPAHLTLQQVVALSGDWYRAALAKQEPDPASEEEYGLRLDMAQDASERGRVEHFVKTELDRLLSEKGLVIDGTSRRALAERLFWDMVTLWNTLIRRSRGDYSPDPHLVTIPAWQDKAAAGALGRGPSFEELVEGWALDATPTPTVKKKFTYHLRLLARHLGTDNLTETHASNVTRADVIAFKEAELKAGKAPKTVWSELAGIGAVFSWAAKNEKIPTNPATKIEVAALKAAKRRGDRPRYPYSTEEAVKILQASRRETNCDLRWLPWLCAFTGARIGEVAGLRARDVEQIDAVWYVAIGLQRQQVKTGSSRRRVPLHRALIAEGFLKYAQSKTPDQRLFSTWAGDNVSGWIREKVGITDPKKGPSHSWRHRFEDEGRSVGIEEDIRDALSGHKNARICREYGAGYTDPRLLHRLVEAINRIPVPPGL